MTAAETSQFTYMMPEESRRENKVINWEIELWEYLGAVT